jgi:hypothetical protein
MAQEQATLRDGGIHEQYTTRRDARDQTCARWSGVERRLADARLVVFMAGLIVGFSIYRGAAIDPQWLWVPGLIFVALILAHEPIRRRAFRASRAREFYNKGLERLEGRWAGNGINGVEFLDDQHPYAADLDLFGTGSLFERLCTARTRSGEETLARWLLVPATPETIRERHAAIDEIRTRLDLREDIELLGRDVRAGIEPAALVEWGAEPRIFPGVGPRIALAILGAFGLIAGVGSFVGAFGFGAPVRYFLFTLLAVAVCILSMRRRVDRVLKAIDQRAHDLLVLSGLLERIEREPFQSKAMLRIKQLLVTEGHPASRQIRKLARLLQLLDARRNQIFLPFALLMLWNEQIALAIDSWRSRSGAAIADWLAAVGEFEAICALAAYAAENPKDPFPEIVIGSARISADDLGHPLIPEASCVRNTISLGEAGSPHVLVVTGSNMSGKSTMLRTVGINVVLALAGAPARASRLRLTPLAIGGTLRIQDSLQSGKSRFFAEITRVRQIVEISRGPIPLLFLLDEIFHGTNSADRRIGAGSIVRGLLDQGAIGLVTTHDLALADIADSLGDNAANVHFEDRFEDGEIRFDFKMKPGIVHHSNALALMRSVGLEV